MNRQCAKFTPFVEKGKSWWKGDFIGGNKTVTRVHVFTDMDNLPLEMRIYIGENRCDNSKI